VKAGVAVPDLSRRYLAVARSLQPNDENVDTITSQVVSPNSRNDRGREALAVDSFGRAV